MPIDKSWLPEGHALWFKDKRVDDLTCEELREAYYALAKALEYERAFVRTITEMDALLSEAKDRLGRRVSLGILLTEES